MLKPSFPLPPLSTIGILGGGQLGRMMAIAAARLGYHVHIYCPEKDCPASEVARHCTIGEYDDIEKLKRFAESVDVVTYEFENIPAEPLAAIAAQANIFPSAQILEISQHRAVEKQTINNMGIATAPFTSVTCAEDILNAAKTLGYPCILKTARMGYDGKGQAMISSKQEIEAALKACTGGVAGNNPELVLEGFVDFSMEISVIVARDINGKTLCYCPVQNIHRHHILAETIAPAPISLELMEKAEEIAEIIAKKLNLVGLLAIEMFVNKNNEIIVNEIAPRPHNSGHWTIDAAATCQFEQAIRAVCGLPLGDPSRRANAKMLNLIGDEVNDFSKYISQKNAKIHLYGKKQIKAGRKMGHITFISPQN